MSVYYATYSKTLRAALWAHDRWLKWRGAAKPTVTPPASPARILLCNQAHLGDATLATAVLPGLRAAYPQAKIGFLVHPGSRPVVDGHPWVKWVHAVEHWHLIRGDASLTERIRRHRTSHREALREIRAVGYQLAIDLHPYFPNSIPLLGRSGIGCLVGWDSAGHGSSLDLVARHDGKPINALDRHARILGLLGIKCDPSLLRPLLHLPVDAIGRWDQRALRSAIGSGFVAVHIGAHVERRRWPASRWVEVLDELTRHGRQVVLLGHGEAEIALGRDIAASCPQVIDLCGQLQWDELLAAIAACAVLLSHDSAAAHLAAAFDRPRICIATGIHDLRTWLRASDNSIVLSKPVACAPCGRVAGCASMACLRGVESVAVIDATLSVLEQHQTENRRLMPRVQT